MTLQLRTLVSKSHKRQIEGRPIVLYTIGYEKATVEDVLTRLQHEGVHVLVDIRRFPVSRKPGFSKSSLARAAESAGITYVHEQAFGNPEYRQAKFSDGWSSRFRRYLRSQHDALREVLEFLDMGCCLLCYERDHSRCHRTIVAEEIARESGRRLEVKHL